MKQGTRDKTLKTCYEMIISNLEILLEKTKTTISDKDTEIKALKEQIQKLESTPLNSSFTADTLNRIPLSQMINYVSEHTKDKGKVSILKRIIEENVELRARIKGDAE
ncbi:MAG: hypothetical protein HQM09_04100 [Candidatus Riflebacteria bacterium]|nr:hypothetical protein [Candidatus Riflebacteria bacterium]